MGRGDEFGGSETDLAERNKRTLKQVALAGVDEHQPMPEKRDDQPAVQDLVIADIQARKLVGLERYGTLLKAGNGRDALMDLYQELLDAVNYIRQVIEERDHVTTNRIVSNADNPVDSVSTDHSENDE